MAQALATRWGAPPKTSAGRWGAVGGRGVQHSHLPTGASFCESMQKVLASCLMCFSCLSQAGPKQTPFWASSPAVTAALPPATAAGTAASPQNAQHPAGCDARSFLLLAWVFGLCYDHRCPLPPFRLPPGWVRGSGDTAAQQPQLHTPLVPTADEHSRGGITGQRGRLAGCTSSVYTFSYATLPQRNTGSLGEGQTLQQGWLQQPRERAYPLPCVGTTSGLRLRCL